MNQGLLLERNGQLRGIRKSFHSSRDVIVRDSARLRPDLSPAHSDLSITDISRATSIHRPMTAEPAKPLWRGSMNRKCWVCNNIVCSCDRMPVNEVNIQVTAPRTAAARVHSNRTVASSVGTSASAVPKSAKYERLHKGLAASDVSSVIPSGQRSSTQTSRSISQRDHPQRQPAEKLSVRKVTRHRLRQDEHGVLHSSEFDDDEVVSTVSGPVDPHYSRPLARNVASTARGSTLLADLAAGAEPVHVVDRSFGKRHDTEEKSTVAVDINSFLVSPVRQVQEESLAWTPVHVINPKKDDAKRRSGKKQRRSSKKRSKSTSSSSSTSSTASSSSSQSTDSDEHRSRSKKRKERRHRSATKPKRGQASPDKGAVQLTEREQLLLDRIEALTNQQQRLQENVAATESQLAVIFAKKSAEEALRQQRKAKQREEAGSPLGKTTSSAAASTSANPSPIPAPAVADDDDVPVHPAFRPRPAAPAPRLYKGGIPMGGGVGHMPAPAPPQDPITPGGYGGFLMRGLVTVVTFPVACCFGRRYDDDDEEVVPASSIPPEVDPALVAQAIQAARDRADGVSVVLPTVSSAAQPEVETVTVVVPPPQATAELVTPSPAELVTAATTETFVEPSADAQTTPQAEEF